MSYIPPHKRVSKNNSEAQGEPSYSIQSPTSFGRQGNRTIIFPNIRRSPFIIRKWLLIGRPRDFSMQLIDYTRPTFNHLEGKSNYQILKSNNNNEAPRDPAGELFDNIKVELQRAIQSFLQQPVGKPCLIIRLGGIIFHDLHQRPPVSITAEELERRIAGTALGRCQKTFETDIQLQSWNTIRDRSIATLERHTERERYLILLKDDAADRTLYLICETDKENAGKVRLRKIKSEAVRYFFADASCFDIPLDIRVMLTSQEKLTNFSNEERECFDNIVASASIEEEQSGGLHWKLGTDSSGRFRVDGVWHKKIHVFNDHSIVLKLQNVFRTERSGYAGRIRREAKILNKDLKECLMGRNMDSFEALLRSSLNWTWSLMQIMHANAC